MLKSRKTLAVAILLFALAAAYLLRFQEMRAIGNLLVVRDRVEKADLIFLLNGDPTVRPGFAALLFKQGDAPAIVIARAEDSPGVKYGAYPNVTDSNVSVLKTFGIPESKIIQLRTPEGVSNTDDEAKALRAYCQQQSTHKVIIVTSEFHSRRARFIFHKVLAGDGVRIMMAPVADRKYGPNDWWKSEDGIIGCQNEYMKLLYYHLRY
jgi:uncharacterized SAM-binding protein YcdF (DUF218 family)